MPCAVEKGKVSRIGRGGEAEEYDACRSVRYIISRLPHACTHLIYRSSQSIYVYMYISLYDTYCKYKWATYRCGVREDTNNGGRDAVPHLPAEHHQTRTQRRQPAHLMSFIFVSVYCFGTHERGEERRERESGVGLVEQSG